MNGPIGIAIAPAKENPMHEARSTPKQIHPDKGERTPRVRVHRIGSAASRGPRHTRLANIGLGLVMLAGLALPPALTARADELADLRAENAALTREVRDLAREVEALKRVVFSEEEAPPQLVPSEGPSEKREAGPRGPHLAFGGQYRINSYSVDDDRGGDSRTASRVRVRQNIDIGFSERFRTHLQLELQHTTDNVTTTSSSSRGTNIDVRHAVLDYTFGNGAHAEAGIVPLSDRFGDTLFSSDWDYNPVALSVTSPFAGGSLRAFAANLAEGDETIAEDDFIHYQLDYALPLARGSELNLGLTLANLEDPTGKDRIHTNYGLSGHVELADGLLLRGFVAGSHTEKELLGTSDDGEGIAAQLELTSESGLGLMVTHASGESDGSGFLPPMALAGTNGYWGYTGILTVQGATDTGFDGDSVNISNNGLGMTSVQVKYARPLTRDFDIHLAGGWFGNSDTPSGRESLVGFDSLLMGTYHFTRILALDFGVAYARLEDSVSGFSNGVIGGVIFNEPEDHGRDKLALFTRLQAEF